MNQKQVNAITLLITFLIYIEISIGTWILTLPNFKAGVIINLIMLMGFCGLMYNKIWEDAEENGRK